MSPPPSRNKIGLLGPYSFGNLGNAALQQALAQQLLRFFPGSEIYGCCIDPLTNRGDNGVLPFPLSRNVRVNQPAPRSADSGIESSRTSPPPAKWKIWLKRIPLVPTGYRLARGILSKCKDPETRKSDSP